MITITANTSSTTANPLDPCHDSSFEHVLNKASRRRDCGLHTDGVLVSRTGSSRGAPRLNGSSRSAPRLGGSSRSYEGPGCASAAAFLLGVVVMVAMMVRGCQAQELVVGARHTWQTPGCHRVGHTRRISIPDCVEFDMTTNACRGYCESWSVLSAMQGRAYNPQQKITSVGQCCNIMSTEDVKVKVMCMDGPRELVFKSAKTCSCFHCKKY